MLNNSDARLQNATNAYGAMEAFKEIEVEQKRQLYIESEKQKSSTRRFWASIIIAGASLIVALLALFLK